MKWLFFACSLLFLAGCSTEGDLSIHNESGPDLEVTVDGSTYLLDDRESMTTRVDLGRRFIFGPEDKMVSVAGEGYCKWDFYELVLVEQDQVSDFTVYGDAGYFDICNETGYAFELYLSPCWADDWGDPIEIVGDGWCTTWKVESDCWDMMVVSIDAQFEDLNVFVNPCKTASYNILPAALTKTKATGPKRAKRAERAEARITTGSGDLRKRKSGGRPAR